MQVEIKPSLAIICVLCLITLYFLNAHAMSYLQLLYLFPAVK